MFACYPQTLGDPWRPQGLSCNHGGVLFNENLTRVISFDVGAALDDADTSSVVSFVNEDTSEDSVGGLCYNIVSTYITLLK